MFATPSVMSACFILITTCVLVVSAIVYGGDMATKPPILKVAHRGGAALAPENTLAAFRKALELHADAVELDVHMSKDGALVVMHDPDLYRTTGTSGEISSCTLAELRTLNAAATYTGPPGEPQRIPTLQEVLALVHGRAGVQIEIKHRRDKTPYAGIEAKIVAAVQQSNMVDAVMVISFDFATLQTISALEPRLHTCALLSAKSLSPFLGQLDPPSVVTDLAAHGFHWVGVKHTRLTVPLMRALRAHNFRLGVWTVDDPSAIRKFAGMGVDFITSNRPDLLSKILP